MSEAPAVTLQHWRDLTSVVNALGDARIIVGAPSGVFGGVEPPPIRFDAFYVEPVVLARTAGVAVVCRVLRLYPPKPSKNVMMRYGESARWAYARLPDWPNPFNGMPNLQAAVAFLHAAEAP